MIASGTSLSERRHLESRVEPAGVRRTTSTARPFRTRVAYDDVLCRQTSQTPHVPYEYEIGMADLVQDDVSLSRN
jgi:hypothetical protein